MELKAYTKEALVSMIKTEIRCRLPKSHMQACVVNMLIIL